MPLLPILPVWLDPDLAVALDLESSCQAACQAACQESGAATHVAQSLR